MDNTDWAAAALVHELVEQAAATYAAHPAVVAGEATLTYAQLNERADHLSRALLHHAPAAELVGISATRGLEMVVGLLAILKAGKAYLPLDLAYPAQRLHQLVAGSGVAFCLATSAEAAAFAALGVAVIASEKDYAYPAQAVATRSETVCVLYTSGSTGQPKGVCLTHPGLVQLLRWQVAHGRAQPGQNTLQFCHLMFDSSFMEVFLPLATGGTVHLIDNTVRLDAGQLLAYIRRAHIHRSYLPYVALQYLAEAAAAEQSFPETLREVITGGEQIKITDQIRSLFAALPGCTLMQAYGPTEASVWVTEHVLPADPATWPDLPHIGWPVVDAELLILDENLALQPPGTAGELCIAGRAVASGYLNQPTQTAERFITWQHPQQGPLRVYRTGDLARYQPDGSLEFLGRRDDQVKIRGNRVEIGEIEVILNRLALLRESVVVARPGPDGQKQLVAYLVAAAGEPSDEAAIRQALAAALPDYMQPDALVWLAALPRTVSDKVDKKLLPAPSRQRPAAAGPYRSPATAIEQLLASQWGEWLQIERLGADDNFFELGGNSLLAQKTVALLKQHQHTLPITKLYQFPTAAAIARYLGPAAAPAPKAAPAAPLAPATAEVAVIGMAGRFPGANSVAELWEVLAQGRETIRFFSPQELDASIPAAQRGDPLYVAARGIIDYADQFDAQFFGLTPRLAELMDPQQRVFLEIAWEALEQTGYLPQTYAGRVGVFAGCGNNTYFLNNVLPNPERVAAAGDFQAMTVNEKEFIASRTAYQLNLTGPAVGVFSACSTSLLAIAQAVQSLRSGQCEVALAGGASITAPVHSGHLYQEGAMLSGNGHCRSFDAQGQGTVFSDGAGVVVLKPLAAAQHDGDTIYAVIKGIGVNNDGGGKGSFTAPSAEGQAGAIGQALADAAVDPATISYLEAHGTATPLGDPIEIEGLTMAFGAQVTKQFCALGSIKSNLGHLTAAAGVAGFIKTVLAMRHQQLPASLGFEVPNPHIDFANSPFFVNTALVPWQPAGTRRAGVSSFGVGGTNVHVVLEEYAAPAPVAPAPAGAGRPAQLITWSAKSAASRDAYAPQLAQHLSADPAASLAEAAFTLHTTRPAFAHRGFVVAGTAAEAAAALQRPAGALGGTKTVAAVPGETVFLFPGQGSQYPHMGRGLYEHEPAFRQAVDDCAALLQGELDVDIRAVLYPAPDSAGAEERLKNTRYTQPALFVTEYALAQLWQSWGVQPSILCGHSVGEFVAAHLAGVFTLADALRLVATRARLVGELPGGRMLAVQLPAAEVLAQLPAALSLAATNGTRRCVVAGPDEAVAAFAQLLEARAVPSRMLATSHAFHSAMMEPVLPAFRAAVATVALHRPQRPVVSTVSGTWLTDAQATDPEYWAQHLRLTVRFAEALDTLGTLPNPLLLEVGPGGALAALARPHLGARAAAVLPGLLPAAAPSDCHAMLASLGQLWLNGLQPIWSGLYIGSAFQKISLPTYVFDRQRCWLDPPAAAAGPLAAPAAEDLPALRPTPVLLLPSAISMRKTTLFNKVRALLEDASGIELATAAPTASFLELGLDSLLLTQMAITLKKEFGLPITFRQLNEEYGTLGQLVDYLDQQLPADAPAAPAPSAPAPAPASAPAAPILVAPAPEPLPAGVFTAGPALPAPAANTALGLLAQQLHLIAQQVALLQASAGGPGPAAVAQPSPAWAAPAPVAAPVALAAAVPVAPVPAPAPTAGLSAEEVAELKKPFGATARIERQATELGPAQQEFLQELTRRYTKKTGASKAYTQQHRARMADPRVVSGFRPHTKELVYPLVVNRSLGSRLWDLDGNEYIDALNGFGSSLLGFQPEVIKAALHAQLDQGYEIGPQHALAGEVSQLLCDFTGFDRVALCNTGSEAVLGAMRVARTVTGRSLVVAFTGSYHGIVDEVLVRGTRQLKSFPAAPGIMPEAVQNMLILDYGTDESLRIIRERAHELAAVLVEPVQSRRPEFRPIAFLKQVREVTAAAGTALIFDEVITGFRLHPGGAQALFGIRADLATYGKVVGGGLAIGVIAGHEEWMDALDGGFWQYGDASFPEVGVTYFAGTFVRHPLALAAAKASLQYLKEQGPRLQQELTACTERLADTLNAELERQQLPFYVAQFSSLWKIKFYEEQPYNELLFALMREKGIHIWDGFPCFLTTAHTAQEVDQIVAACLASARELVAAGFLQAPRPAAARPPAPRPPAPALGTTEQLNQPPAPGARLGRDRAGNPAWFVADPSRPDSYRQLSVH